MKSLFIWGLLSLALLFTACSKSDEKPAPADELEGLVLVKTISNATHAIDLYTASGKFETGYNSIYFQIKTTSGSLVDNATSSWMPVMKMMNMSHSCPFSVIEKKQGAQYTYQGFIVFQMQGNDMEYWELSLNYTINGQTYTIKERIQVTDPIRRKVQSVMGSDNKRYVLAMMEPSNPKVALNDMSVLLYTMTNMMQFDPVDNYTIQIDPRMPGMGNHGSPNNIHLTQGADKIYRGKLSLTMTGYWKINLQLQNANGTVVKGEPVAGDNESSSLFFEVEF
ncbi:MAG: hypothetical protein JNK20_11655 [Flavipsychrobacter sp.]|nr:hypothetical protein [Flavipsychrobacter sp.]